MQSGQKLVPLVTASCSTSTKEEIYEFMRTWL
jgi:hypothetical protein